MMNCIKTALIVASVTKFVTLSKLNFISCRYKPANQEQVLQLNQPIRWLKLQLWFSQLIWMIQQQIRVLPNVLCMIADGYQLTSMCWPSATHTSGYRRNLEVDSAGWYVHVTNKDQVQSFLCTYLIFFFEISIIRNGNC